MMISWLILVFAGLCEVGFVMMMKLSDGFKNLKFSILTILFMSLSLYSLSQALTKIPIGTGYAVWTGIGAVGSILAGILFFKESRSILKFVFMLMILAGIVGLKMSSN